MKYIKISPNEYCICLQRGEEIMHSITNFCNKHKIWSGYFHGIGATNNLTIGIYNEENKNYVSTNLLDSFEITNLLGNISYFKNKPFIHSHINVCDSSLKVKGGHLQSAIVSVTCEIFLTKSNKKLIRQFDKQTGINILNF